MLRRAFTLLVATLGLAGFALSANAANPQVDLDTSAGKIRLELFPEAAPATVENFLAYVKAKQYDGTQFHRVIAGFMIQGGGYASDFTEKPTRAPIANEADKSSKAGLLNTPGTIAMARTSAPNSATAQFFINVGDNKFLNYRDPSPAGIGYTVFGKVIQGMEVVEKIAKTPTAAGGPFSRDVPIEHIVIKSATVVGTP
jgi:peptidyl-prolyl cis-trans isomerase A (cyclophilin A)/peptidyl-prolyl cis-trans isomerase B (cyclophilin B)